MVGIKLPLKRLTKLPGPNSLRLMELRHLHVPRGVFHVTPIFVQKAHGGLVEDVDGNELIDFASGIGVINFGHTEDRIVTAVSEQVKAHLHLGFNVTPYESYVELAEKLNRVTPGSFKKKTFLANSGSEAVENAIKIARSYTGRPAIIGFEHAFHGRTYLAMTLTHKVKPYKERFAPFVPEIYRAPFPYVYRWKPSTDADTVAQECYEAFEELVCTQVSPKQVAAVIIEPVLGEGGIVPAPPLFLKKLKSYCSSEGILFIADEIQTGFGRTGTLFACEQMGIEPDLITTAKGLGGGLPLSAVTGRAEVMDAPAVGGIGGTYGGNPLACRSALAQVDIFEKTSVLQRAKILGQKLEERLNVWKRQYSFIGDVRGLGPMRAIEFVKNRETKAPYPEAVQEVIKKSYENGLVIMGAGTWGNVLRFLIPLGIEDELFVEGLDILDKSLRNVCQTPS